MKNAVNRILDRTEAVATAVGRDFASINAAAGRNAPLLMLALTPPILAAFAITEIGTWCIGEIGRQIRIREKRPASPSLRGTPSPADLAAPWSASPRTLRDRLRLGSRLADLDPTLDHTISRTTLPSGKTVFRARPGGMKGWLADRRVAIPYSTAMRYKKLAQRLRQILDLDDRIPLDWLVDGLPSAQSLPSSLFPQYQSARRRLSRFLRENPNLKALSLAADKALGIIRLVSVRKAKNRQRAATRKNGKTTKFSVISRGHSVTVTPDRLEGTKEAISRILRANHLSGQRSICRRDSTGGLQASPSRPQLEALPAARFTRAPPEQFWELGNRGVRSAVATWKLRVP